MTQHTGHWLKIAATVALILLPTATYVLFSALSERPIKIRIGAGKAGGQYDLIARALETAIHQQYPQFEVELVQTDGSLENLFRLETNNVDLAMYQPGAMEAVYQHDPKTLMTLAERMEKADGPAADPSASKLSEKLAKSVSGSPPPLENVRFVANLYRQPAHLIVRPGLDVRPDNLSEALKTKSVALGIETSGDFAMGHVLLEHLGLRPPDVTIHTVKPLTDPDTSYYSAVVEDFALADGTHKYDAAFLTVGVRADVFQELAAKCDYDIVGIPNIEALLSKHLYLSRFSIPAGMYGVAPRQAPEVAVETVASGAQLLTHAGADPYVVEAVTRIVLDKHFAKQNGLRELLEGDRAFAHARPEFPVHDGAQSVYDPDFDYHVFESFEAAYSMLASAIIVSFLTFRWLRRNREKAKEHRLDRYIRLLLEIERRQVPLDSEATTDDREELQELLDKVTMLRQRALGEFTAHELKEDEAADCFINMCHALSNKINAKLSRQRLDLIMTELIEAIRDSGDAQPSGAAAPQEMGDGHVQPPAET